MGIAMLLRSWIRLNSQRMGTSNEVQPVSVERSEDQRLLEGVAQYLVEGLYEGRVSSVDGTLSTQYSASST